MANNRIDRISELYGRALAEAIRQVKDPRVSGAHCPSLVFICSEGGRLMANNRIDRISELYGRALAEAIRQVKDPRVSGAFVSVTHCEVTNDLRYAKAYISVLGADDQAKEVMKGLKSAAVMKGLKSAAGWLRREVGHAVQLRYAPELVFTLDHSIESGAHINDVIHQLAREGKMGAPESGEEE